MTEIETIAFDKGINRKKGPLFLESGELYSCAGYSLETAGELKTRTPVTQQGVIDADGTINGIHRYIDSIIASSKAYCPGEQVYFNYIYQRDVTGTYFNVALMAGNVRPAFADFEKFIFCVDGESKYAFIDEKVYPWGVANPYKAPAVAVGAAGNPDGEYYCYVTFYIIFPNDKVVETGPSAAGTVTASTQKIEWTGIPTCDFTGEGLSIQRRLWRTVSGVAYLVTTLTNNTVTTYSDNVTDANLQLSTILGTTSYSTPPDGMIDLEVYLQRVFGIKDNRLYFSEAYVPFSFLTTSDIVVTKDDENLVSVIKWGDQIFLVSNETWRRLQGSDPDTWAIKQTFADSGIINRHTLKVTKYGLIGLWYDGIHLFDGSTTKNITERVLGRNYFLDVSDWTTAYAEYDGQTYNLYYDSAGSGLDSCLKLDFTYYPEIRAHTSDFVPDAHEYYTGGGIQYFAMDGYEYDESGTETIATSLQTGDLAFKNILKRKHLEYLYYDIDTGGTDVTLTVYADGVSAWITTINESSRKRKRHSLLPNIDGYRFSVKLDCADSSDVVIYSPWALSANIVGD